MNVPKYQTKHPTEESSPLEVFEGVTPMAWRFYRRQRICKGISLNWSKSGPSISMGRRGAHFTVGSRGSRTSVGLPGTGISYTTEGHSPNLALVLIATAIIALLVIYGWQ